MTSSEVNIRFKMNFNCIIFEQKESINNSDFTMPNEEIQ